MAGRRRGRPAAPGASTPAESLAVAWRSGAQQFASSGQDGEVRLWDARSSAAKVIHAAPQWSERLAFSGQRAMAGRGHRPRAAGIRGRAATARAQLPPQTAVIAALAWRPKSNELAALGNGGARLHRLEPELQTREFSLAGRLPDRELEPGRPDPGLRHAGRLGALLEYRRRQPVADARVRRQGGADQLERQQPAAGHGGRSADHRLGFLGSRVRKAASRCSWRRTPRG